MTPERWRRVDELFHAALRLDPAERELEHQPVLDEGEATREQPDHSQLEGLEPEHRDGPTAREQGDEAPEHDDEGRVETIQRQVVIREDAAPP